MSVLKPEYYTPDPVINYRSIMIYIRDKYGISDDDKHHFWDHILDCFGSQISNPCTLCLPIKDFMEEGLDYSGSPLVQKISEMIYAEFGEDEMNVSIDW